jgi:electron transport complex protein RnfD
LPLLVVDTPPFIHRNVTVRKMMLDTLIALAPAGIMALFTYGLPALRVMALSAGVAVLTEALWERFTGQPPRIWDLTALVYGLLFAFLLPAGAPWWLVVVGSAFMIIFGREVFGGFGSNPLCPPLVAWAAMTVAWPLFMDPTAMNLSSNLMDPLLKLKYYGATSLPPGSGWELLLGRQLGGLGSSQILAALAGGLFLVYRGDIRWEIPLFFIASVLLTAWIFWQFGPAMGVNPANTPAPHLYLLTGSVMFVAFFLATEHSASPVGMVSMLPYCLVAGAMVVFIRIFGIYPDGAPFAVLLASLGTPLYDLVGPKPYGSRKKKR